MSAELVHALSAEAHRLDAEADNAASTDQGGVEPMIKHEIADTLRNIAQRVQGNDPAKVAADEAAASEAGGGLSIEKS